MQTKGHATKTYKIFLFQVSPTWKTLEEQKFKSHYINKNSEITNNVGNEEMDLRGKNLLSWQNVWNSGQIATDIKKDQQIKKRPFVEKSALFIFPYKTNVNHSTELSTAGHVFSEGHQESTFNFSEIVSNLNSNQRMLQFKIFFSISFITRSIRFHSVYILHSTQRSVIQFVSQIK